MSTLVSAGRNEDAKALAKKENKLILADFTGSDWCGWCIKLKDEVFSKPEFQTWAAIIGAFAFILGGVNLIQVNYPKIRRRETDWQYKVVMVVAAETVAAAMVAGADAAPHRPPARPPHLPRPPVPMAAGVVAMVAEAALMAAAGATALTMAAVAAAIAGNPALRLPLRHRLSVVTSVVVAAAIGRPVAAMPTVKPVLTPSAPNGGHAVKRRAINHR